MTAFIDAAAAADGSRRLFRCKSPIKCVIQSIWGIPILFLAVELPDGTRAKAAGKRLALLDTALRERGVRRLLFSDRFPYKEFFISKGYGQPGDTLLYEAVAWKIAGLFSGEGRSIAILAEKLTARRMKDIEALCRGYRYVLTDVGAGGFQDHLQKTIGVSVIGRPNQRRLREADVALFLDPPDEPVAFDRNTTVIANEGFHNVSAFSSVSGLTLKLRPRRGICVDTGGLRPEPLIELALEAGILSPGDIEVLEADTCPADDKSAAVGPSRLLTKPKYSTIINKLIIEESDS